MCQYAFSILKTGRVYPFPFANEPYTILGPYLHEPMQRSFITNHHNPYRRPTAAEWELALSKTIDMLSSCHNPTCPARGYVKFIDKL